MQRLSSERFKLLRAAHPAQCVLCHPPLKDPHCSLLVDHSPPVVWSESHIIGQQMEISACDPLSRARNGVPPAPRCAMLIINHGCPQTKILLSWNTMEHKGHHCQGSLRAWRGAVVQGLIGCSGPGVVHGFFPLHTYVAFRDNYSSALYCPQRTEVARELIELVLWCQQSQLLMRKIG